MGAAGSEEPEQEDTAVHSRGELFLYNVEAELAAFEFGITESSKALVCIGGLTDGLLSIRYLPKLAQTVSLMGWRVVQPVLASSYTGWGVASLDEDVKDIDALLDNLSAERNITQVVLLGHSTGCQDVVKYLAIGANVGMVAAAVLQAPVSDREAIALTNTGGPGGAEADLEKYRAMATQMIREGRGDEVMPRAACLLIGPPHAITANRFNSLTGRMTDDDMFSSDLTDDELATRLGHVDIPTLIALSLDDEYVSAAVNGEELAARMQAAMAAHGRGAVQTLLIKEGGHALGAGAGADIFVEVVRDFAATLPAPS